MPGPVTEGGQAPNTHKVFVVKRKYFPQPRGLRRFSWRLFSGVNSGGEGYRSAARLGYSGQTRRPGPRGPRRAAPNTHADSGGPAPQSKAAVPGAAPRPVPILMRSRSRGQSKCGRLTHTLGSVPFGRASRPGRVVRRFSPFTAGTAAGVGWTLGGLSAPTRFLGTASR